MFQGQARNWRRCPRGAGMYFYFRGAKALFSYISCQVNDSAEGVAKLLKIFHLEALPQCSLHVRACSGRWD